jgi:hypothetical protein
MYQSPHETFLNDILGVLKIPSDPQRETEDLAVVSFINLAKCWQALRRDPVGIHSVGISPRTDAGCGVLGIHSCAGNDFVTHC